MIYQAAVGVGTKFRKHPQLTKQMLLEYVKADDAVFYVFLKLIIDIKCKQSHGNVFVQVINDEVMLANHKKYQSLALQLIGHFWRNNLVACCGFSY